MFSNFYFYKRFVKNHPSLKTFGFSYSRLRGLARTCWQVVLFSRAKKMWSEKWLVEKGPPANPAP